MSPTNSHLENKIISYLQSQECLHPVAYELNRDRTNTGQLAIWEDKYSVCDDPLPHINTIVHTSALSWQLHPYSYCNKIWTYVPIGLLEAGKVFKS